MVYPLLWQLTIGKDSCFKWSVHMNHGIIIALSWWEYWKIYPHAQCKELIGVCFQGHIATLYEPKKTGRVVMRHFQYSTASLSQHLYTDCCLHTHTQIPSACNLYPHVTFTQGFTSLNTQWCAVFTCVVMFSKSYPINSGGPFHMTQW